MPGTGEWAKGEMGGAVCGYLCNSVYTGICKHIQLIPTPAVISCCCIEYLYFARTGRVARYFCLSMGFVPNQSNRSQRVLRLPSSILELQAV